MDSLTLSRLLDKAISQLLAEKHRSLNAGRKKVRVVITGEDLSTLPVTLTSLLALDKAGYQLLVTFSHSASLSGLQSACIKAVAARCTGALFTERGPQPDDEDYCSLFLPALSTNSLTKIALGIRDNIVSRWVFHALGRQKQIIVTLNPECHSGTTVLPAALLATIAKYVATLVQFGIVISGKKMTSLPRSVANGEVVTGKRDQLITLKDVRLLAVGETLFIARHTLVTPAAQDEIRDQNITVIRGS